MNKNTENIWNDPNGITYIQINTQLQTQDKEKLKIGILNKPNIYH